MSKNEITPIEHLNKRFNFLKKQENQVKALSFVFLLLFAVNLNTPLWGNILVGFGALNHSGFYYSFPDLVYNADYLRGPVYKFMLYFISKSSSLFIELASYWNFQLVSKLLYYLILFIISFLSLRITSDKKSIAEILLIWLASWCLIFLGGYRSFMESEELSVVFALTHFLFITSDNKMANYLSGVFVFLLFGCKAITILYAGFGLLYWVLFVDDKNKSIRIIISHFSFLLFTLLAFMTIFKQEIYNTQEAMLLQGALSFDGLLITIKQLVLGYYKSIAYIPLLSIVFFTFPVMLFKGNLHRTLYVKRIVYFLGAFFIASTCVVLQNRFSSPYHYLSFLPLIFISIKWSLDFNVNLFKILFSIILIYYLLLSFKQDGLLNRRASNWMYKDFFISQIYDYTVINNYLNSTGEMNDHVLLLTGDSPPFFINKPGWGGYYHALIANRTVLRPHIINTKLYQDYVQSVKDYNGLFILHDPGFVPINKLEFVQEKLNDYELIFQMHTDIKNMGEDEIGLYRKKGTQPSKVNKN